MALKSCSASITDSFNQTYDIIVLLDGSKWFSVFLERRMRIQYIETLWDIVLFELPE